MLWSHFLLKHNAIISCSVYYIFHLCLFLFSSASNSIQPVLSSDMTSNSSSLISSLHKLHKVLLYIHFLPFSSLTFAFWTPLQYSYHQSIGQYSAPDSQSLLSDSTLSVYLSWTLIGHPGCWNIQALLPCSVLHWSIIVLPFLYVDVLQSSVSSDFPRR